MTNHKLPTVRTASSPVASNKRSIGFVQKVGSPSVMISIVGVGAITAAMISPVFTFALFVTGSILTLVGGTLGLVRYIEGGHYLDGSGRDKPPLELEFKELKRSISKVRYEDGFAREDFVQDSVENLERFEGQFQLYLKQIKIKFSPGELTYQRYLSAGEDMNSALFSLFQDLQQVLEQISLFNESKLRSQKQPNSEEHNSKLEKLDGLWERAKDIDKLIHDALATLDNTTEELSKITTDSGDKKQELESIMAQLQNLAERAKKYSAK
jgi:hypothetical protein